MSEGPTEPVPTEPDWANIPAHRPLQPDDPREIGGYRLRARLGEGGMGRVYLSYTPGGRPVAIKVIRAEFADDPGFRRRFEQEVATAQRVQGVYTAPVIDANTHSAQPWLATAYVPGPSLQQAVGVYGPLPDESVLVLVAGVAEALQAIHAAGIVHRDLKPSNVILAADGPRVIDFGIARAVDTTSVTQAGVKVGTPAFMAPEQVRGHSATPAVDVFALGALACFAATAELPFGGGLDPLVPHRILEEEPDLSACPKRLHDLVTRCLAKDPRQRPSPTQVIELCRQVSTGTRLQMGEGWLPPSVAAAVNRIATAPAPEPEPVKRVRRRLLALTAATVVVAAAAAITTAVATGAFRTNTAGSPGPGSTATGGPTSTTTTEPSVTTSTAGRTTTTQTSASPAPSDEGLPPFAPSNETVRSGGQVRLTIDRGANAMDLSRWEAEAEIFVYRGIEFTEAGLSGLEGTQFGLLADGTPASFDTCRNHTQWISAITWRQVHRGSFSCLRTSNGQRGILRIDEIPNFDDNSPTTVLTGNVWERIVDR
jgi:serine/threonine protein kinase